MERESKNKFSSTLTIIFSAFSGRALSGYLVYGFLLDRLSSEIFKINHQEVTDDSQANGMHTLLVPAVVYSPIITENYGIFTEFDTLKDRQ